MDALQAVKYLKLKINIWPNITFCRIHLPLSSFFYYLFYQIFCIILNLTLVFLFVSFPQVNLHLETKNEVMNNYCLADFRTSVA